MSTTTGNIAKVFKNYVPNCKVFTPEGRQITFVNGSHITQIEKDIEYLQSCVDAGDQYVYIDPNEVEVNTEELTVEGRMAKLKREAVEEYLATVAAASAQNSISVQSDLGAGTSKDLVTSIASNGAATVVPATSSEDKAVEAPAAVSPAPQVNTSGIKAGAVTPAKS